ncbi:MAG TPA: hypothetical protein VHR97_07135 [Candidatus Baltobacteraceae bacterium]|jgi:hypothetical protein|nr:hypothetical protein [Candidatus Baltobacteraceae bacterium]
MDKIETPTRSALWNAVIERHRAKIDEWPMDHPERNGFIEGLHDGITFASQRLGVRSE